MLLLIGANIIADIADTTFLIVVDEKKKRKFRHPPISLYLDIIR